MAREYFSHELEAVLSEAEEDHLGVALIQPGGSRYEQMKWQISWLIWLQADNVEEESAGKNIKICNKGGTA